MNTDAVHLAGTQRHIIFNEMKVVTFRVRDAVIKLFPSSVIAWSPVYPSIIF